MKLVTFVRSLWKRPREQPNVNIPFLQLPVELLGYIATFLSPADAVLLSQTCRLIRACLTRDLPEQWVCDYCMALHPINKRDKPTTARRPCSCPMFLLLSIWRYFAGGRDLMLQHLGCQQICPHLEFRDNDYFKYNNDLLQTFLLAFQPGYGDVEWRSACPRCATDYSVMLSGRNLYLQVWQDFGPEGSPLDLAWRSQNIRPGLDGVRNSEKVGPTLYHESGSIRELYGPAPEILPVPKRRSKWISFPQERGHAR
ncbi:hypothetical protein GQX73_g8895 [Xylaria multiplex]|uniref:F-box domain-containing protein n=1 Tax=Xylaria multiplex TaxID=323545 RepID=A0A7C8MK85_9PEZI|nr:hypothetical protein GQX73_g8895 [Xylaria multiplex]